MAKPAFVPLGFARGLKQSQEPSTFLPSEQFLTECDNWVPEPTGALRIRPGWSLGTDDGLPATRTVRGIGMFNRLTDPAIRQYVRVQTSVALSGSVTPTFTWPNPTLIGSTLVLLVAAANSDASASQALTTTVTGWTTRLAVGTAGVNEAGVYELVATQAFSGDVTPVTFALAAGADLNRYLTCWLVELTGVSTFDLSATTSGTGTTTAPVTSTTNQASEIVLGFDATRRASSTTAFTLSGSTGWQEVDEAGQSAGDGYQEAAFYFKTVRATGTQSITVTSSVSVAHESVVLTYKGWNTDAIPSERAEQWLAALDDGATYDVYAIDRDELASGTYTAVDTDLGSTSDGLPVAFVSGLGGAHYSASSFGAVRSFDGLTASNLTGSPVGARCLAIHRNRLFAAGTPANPGRLWWSQAGDPNDWREPPVSGGGHIDVSPDETIEDITPFADALVICTRTSAWALFGASPAEFQVIRLTGGAAAPGRTVVATPVGCIMAGVDTVYLWDGSSGPEPISEAIERDYGMTGAYLTVSRPDDDHYLYICDAGSGTVWAFDIQTGVWRTETVNQASEAPAVVYSLAGRQVYGPRAGTTVGALSYRDFPNPERKVDFDGALGMSYAATTTDLWLAGPWGWWTPANLFCRLRQRDGSDDQSPLEVTATYDGTATDPKSVQPRDAPEVFRASLPVGKGGVASGIYRFTQTLGTDETAAMDIEDVMLTVDVETEPS